MILRGLLAGTVGAVLAFGFARLFAEPSIGRAIEYEDGRAEALHAPEIAEHGPELFSRAVQSNAGLGFGVVLFGIALGALVAVVFCVTYQRWGGSGAQTLAIRLTIGAFAAVYLVPVLKYPPNPPAVGRADTIGTRTSWYFVMVLISVLLAVAAIWLFQRLSARFSRFNAAVFGSGVYVIGVALAMLVLPSFAETPAPLRGPTGAITYPGFPADVLYEFRLASLGAQLVLWGTTGLLFSTLAQRLLEKDAGGWGAERHEVAKSCG